MAYEARITVHNNGNQAPDYKEVHRRMEAAGYQRTLVVGGRLLSELHGMYRKISSGSIEMEKTTIEQELKTMGHRFSIELFHIDATRSFNLEPAPSRNTLYSALYGLKD